METDLRNSVKCQCPDGGGDASGQNSVWPGQL